MTKFILESLALTDKADIRSESLAAVIGGTTTYHGHAK
jgi:dihydroorotase-like cyclic amidohydrolase